MQSYVLSFCFSKNLEYVLLIEKKTKNKKGLGWMDGKLNAPGGKVNEGETADDAVVREFKEETNLFIEKWKCFGTFDVQRGIPGTIHLYVAKSDSIFQAKSVTKEKISLVWLNKLKFGEFIQHKTLLPNMRFLLPLALNALDDAESCKFFTIQENK